MKTNDNISVEIFFLFIKKNMKTAITFVHIHSKGHRSSGCRCFVVARSGLARLSSEEEMKEYPTKGVATQEIIFTSRCGTYHQRDKRGRSLEFIIKLESKFRLSEMEIITYRIRRCIMKPRGGCKRKGKGSEKDKIARKKF